MGFDELFGSYMYCVRRCVCGESVDSSDLFQLITGDSSLVVGIRDTESVKVSHPLV